MRHTFTINLGGILQEIFLGVKPTIHSQEVLSSLDNLQQI